jgi:hypothetical protein
MHFFPAVARVKCGDSEKALTSQDVLFLELRDPRADCDASALSKYTVFPVLLLLIFYFIFLKTFPERDHSRAG